MRHIKSMCVFAMMPVAVGANTRYSGAFDYHQFEPSAVYFAGHSQAEVAHLCDTGEHASTEDLEECAHREFERASTQLNRTLATLTEKVRKTDIELKQEDEPVAQPYFLKAQAAWVQYRDNYCYSDAYEVGPGSGKYTLFWNCMASMTKDRIKQLTRPGN